MTCRIFRQALTADIDDDDIGADFLNVFIRDDIVGLIVKKVKEFVAARNNKGAYLSAALVKFQIADFSQTFAVL